MSRIRNVPLVNKLFINVPDVNMDPSTNFLFPSIVQSEEVVVSAFRFGVSYNAMRILVQVCVICYEKRESY